MKEDAKPRKQRPYTYNENFGRKIKEEIDKLLDAEFIYEIEHTEWVSPIVVVPKKNGKLRVCVNLKQVNAATVRDNYPLPITDHVLERVAGSKPIVSLMDSQATTKYPLLHKISTKPLLQQNGGYSLIESCLLG